MHVCMCIHVHLRSISFFIWCLTQWGVGDCGQPQSVFHQDQHTEHNTVNTRHWTLLTLSVPLSLEYSIKNVRMRSISNISTGRRLNSCKVNITTLCGRLSYKKCTLSSASWTSLIKSQNHWRDNGRLSSYNAESLTDKSSSSSSSSIFSKWPK